MLGGATAATDNDHGAFCSFLRKFIYLSLGGMGVLLCVATSRRAMIYEESEGVVGTRGLIM